MPAYIISALGLLLGAGLCMQLILQERVSQAATRTTVGHGDTTRSAAHMRSVHAPTTPVFVITTPSPGAVKSMPPMPPKTPVTDAEIADWHNELQLQFRRAEASPQLPHRRSLPLTETIDLCRTQ